MNIKIRSPVVQGLNLRMYITSSVKSASRSGQSLMLVARSLFLTKYLECLSADRSYWQANQILLVLEPGPQANTTVEIGVQAEYHYFFWISHSRSLQLSFEAEGEVDI